MNYAVARPLPPPSEAHDRRREAALVRAAQRGSVQAFEQLVQLHGPLLHRFLHLRLGNESDANDALQDTLAIAWTDLKALRDPNSVRAWLLTVAARQANAMKRRGARQPSMQAGHAGDAAGRVELRAALAALPPERRDVVLLRYLIGFSEAETASALGISVGTVKSRAARAREAIATFLDLPEDHR